MPGPALTSAAPAGPAPRGRATLAASVLLGLAACAAWGPVADTNPAGPALLLPGARAAGGASSQRPADALLAWWQRFDDPLLGRSGQPPAALAASLATAGRIPQARGPLTSSARRSTRCCCSS